MLSIFSKKTYLIDLLNGFTDIHCHVLPGIDDGAKDLEASIFLIEEYAKLGIKSFIATPHIMHGLYPNSKASISKAMQAITSILPQQGLGHITIRAAAEYMIDSNFDSLVKENELLALKDNYILIEMSYLQPPAHLNSSLTVLMDHGYIPVLAHPERYGFYHQKTEAYTTLKEKGCLFQLNALSLSGYYGNGAQQIAFKLLENGLYNFIGTDTHNYMHIKELSTITVSKKHKKHIQTIVEMTKNAFSIV